MEHDHSTVDEQSNAVFTNAPVGKNALNFGMLTGLALILFSLVLYLLDQVGNSKLGNVSMLLLIGGIFYGIWYYKMKLNHGFMSMGKGISTGVLISLWAGILGGVFAYLLYTVIDPGLIDKMIEMGEERMLRQNPDMGDQEYEMAMSWMMKTMKPGFIAIMSVVANVVVGLIASLIFSAIIKKEPDTVH